MLEYTITRLMISWMCFSFEWIMILEFLRLHVLVLTESDLKKKCKEEEVPSFFFIQVLKLQSVQPHSLQSAKISWWLSALCLFLSKIRSALFSWYNEVDFWLKFYILPSPTLQCLLYFLRIVFLDVYLVEKAFNCFYNYLPKNI